MPKWLTVLKQVGTVVAAVAAGPVLGPIIVGAISEAEKIKGASGAEKKAHAIELVKAGAAAANAVAKKDVINLTEAASVADNAIDTVVGVVNLTHKGALPEPTVN